MGKRAIKEDSADFLKHRRIRPPGLHRAIPGSRGTVFLGEDRVTVITCNILSEKCRHIALQDLLGVTISRTLDGRIGNIFFSVGAFIVLLFGLGSMSPGDYAGIVTALIIAAILLFFVLLNTALGPTCRCYLRTAVQHSYVPSATRLNPARQLALEVGAAVRIAQSEVVAALEIKKDELAVQE